ncbi:MAG: glycosyltransferase family 39 protein [Planctomycetota bacterium]
MSVRDRKLLILWLAIVPVVLALGKVVLLMASGITLTPDEAQYWDWSRRAGELSFYTKGPGVAQAIGAATSILGHEAWAVRLPAVLSGLVLVITVAITSYRLKASARVASAAVLATLAIPAYWVTSVVMTIDGPYLACWAIAGLLALEVNRRWSEGRGAPLLSIALGWALGYGFLFKYTILLMLPGLVIYLLYRFVIRRAGGRVRVGDVLLAIIAFGYMISDVIIWNQMHAWPTVSHLLGHLGVAGGDLAVDAGHDRGGGKAYSPLWTLEFLGLQFVTIGPMVLVIALAIARRIRKSRFEWDDLLLLALGAPVLIFYLGVTIFTSGEANWPIAGYITLVPLAAREVAVAMRSIRARRVRWIANGKATREGILRRSPESPIQIAWHWSLGFGSATMVGLTLIAIIGATNSVSLLPDSAMVRRASGSPEVVAAVERARDESPNAFIIANRYQTAATLAYELRDQPVVSCASAWLGDRATSYDYFEDTRLDREPLAGAMVILVGSDAAAWRETFDLDLTILDEAAQVYRASQFPDLERRVP